MFRTAALFAILALATASPAQGDPLASLLDEADQAIQEGDPLKASSLFQASLERASQLSPKQQARALKGMRSACRGLIEKRKLEASVRALVFLFKASKKTPLGQAFEDQVRTDLDQLAFDLVLTGKPQLAIEALKVLMAEGPGPPMRWALLARAHIERGEFEKATQTLKRGLSLHPASPELLFVRAALAGTLSELAVARANYASAESMLQRAASDLKQALEKEPTAAGIHRALGKIRGALWVYYRATGQYRRSVEMLVKAEDSYARASTLQPADPDVFYELANLLFVAHDWVWAEQTYASARSRYRRLLATGKLSPALARQTSRQLEACRDAITQCRHKRAIQAAAAGQFARARELVQQAVAERPTYAAKAKRFLTLLAQAEQAHQQLTAELEDQPGSVEAQRRLGDLWTRLGKYDRAVAAYQRALQAGPDETSRLDLDDRLYGVEDLPDTSVRIRIGIGELDVAMDLPPGLDPSRMRASLEKAHALTMAGFDHKLIGSLELKVFANKRLFLEQAGVDLGPHQEGLYAFGRVVTFDTPGRSRAKWLDILVHEITHRYVDEMSYNRAPRWLSEGLAQWVSQGWTRQHRSRFDRLSRAGELVPWSDLENAFAERWDDPRLLNTMYLQAHQIVHWLMRRYGRARVMTLLAALRQGKQLDEASGMAFGGDLSRLEQAWKREQR